MQIRHLFCRRSLGYSHADTKDSVGSKFSLVWSAIKAFQELINLALVFEVEVLLDQGRSNGIVDIGYSFGDALKVIK